MTEKLTKQQEADKALAEQKRKAIFQAINKMDTSTVAINRNNGFKLKYAPEQINLFLQNPSKFQKELRQLSDYLYDYSAEYRWIIDYVSNLGKFDYVIDTLNFLDNDTDYKAFEKAKLKVATQLNKMRLNHELAKTMRMAWKHDVVYCYERETKDSYLIQHMDADYCRISGLDYNGYFLYDFDFSYFDGNKDVLTSFPDEFNKLYQTYIDTRQRWQALDSTKSFAFKVNEEIQHYPLLPFSMLFDPIMDYEEYKKIQKAKIKMDNFMLLAQKIPINDKSQSMDDFLISLETAMEFHNFIVAGLEDNSGIGIVTTPMDISSIRTDNGGSKDRDSTAMALRSIFDAGGISQFLSNSDKNTSTGVNKSIIVDEQKVFKMYRQIEGWLNSKIRRMTGKFKFKVRILDTTSFDENKNFDLFLKGAQNGLPVTEEVASTLGVYALDFHNKLAIENSEIGYQIRMQPLQTSHTQSSKDEVGRNKLSDNEISDSGQVNRDNNTDENRE